MSGGVSAVVVVVIWVVGIAAAKKLAVRKNRLPGNWGLAVLLAGPLALLVLALLPTGHADAVQP